MPGCGSLCYVAKGKVYSSWWSCVINTSKAGLNVLKWAHWSQAAGWMAPLLQGSSQHAACALLFYFAPKWHQALMCWGKLHGANMGLLLTVHSEPPESAFQMSASKMDSSG